jgi:hypothetical protein
MIAGGAHYEYELPITTTGKTVRRLVEVNCGETALESYIREVLYREGQPLPTGAIHIHGETKHLVVRKTVRIREVAIFYDRAHQPQLAVDELVADLNSALLCVARNYRDKHPLADYMERYLIDRCFQRLFYHNTPPFSETLVFASRSGQAAIFGKTDQRPGGGCEYTVAINCSFPVSLGRRFTKRYNLCDTCYAPTGSILLAPQDLLRLLGQYVSRNKLPSERKSADLAQCVGLLTHATLFAAAATGPIHPS